MSPCLGMGRTYDTSARIARSSLDFKGPRPRLCSAHRFVVNRRCIGVIDS